MKKEQGIEYSIHSINTASRYKTEAQCVQQMVPFLLSDLYHESMEWKKQVTSPFTWDSWFLQTVSS